MENIENGFWKFWSAFQEKVFVNFQVRKKDGQRGALLAGMVNGYAPAPVITQGGGEAADALRKALASKLDPRRGGILEGIAWAAESGGVTNTLLIDDLSPLNVEAVLKFWPGAIAITETSQDNYQSILRSPRALDRVHRSHVQQALANRFGTDLNAAKSPVQPHRYPGSINWKTGEPFVTRLHRLVQDGDDTITLALIDQLLVDQQQACTSVVTPLTKPMVHSPILQRGGYRSTGARGSLDSVTFNSTGDASKDAYRFACAAIRHGHHESEIEAHIEQSFNTEAKHQKAIWARRTAVAAAQFVRTGVYTTGRTVRK